MIVAPDVAGPERRLERRDDCGDRREDRHYDRQDRRENRRLVRGRGSGLLR